MNNKLFARIMTAVICICMMSTVVFAAETGATPTLTDVDADTKALGFVVDGTNIIAPATTADQVTMMAYLVDAETAYADAAYVDEDTTPMIAIDQYDGNDIAETVNVLASKIVDGMKVVVQTGDSNEGGDKWIIAQEVVEDEVIVTVMNGATAIDVEADADGNVTLPTTAEFGKTSPAGYTFALYSWVTEDGATEHLAGAKVAAADLEGKTLYAKFATTVARGDLDGNGEFNTSDFNPIAFKIKNINNAVLLRGVGSAIYEGSTILKGDLDGNGEFNTSDFNPIAFKIKNIPNVVLLKDVDKPYYVVNK